MGAVLDPLRNTLDQLALDPRARDDRRYLASVLRRLGYSETEIAAALGYETDGPRIIEVEYQPPGQKPRRGDFTVVADWQGQEEVAFSVARDEDPARAHGWMPTDAALAHGWLLPEEDGVVRFRERDAAWGDDWPAEDAEAEPAAWPAEQPETAWPTEPTEPTQAPPAEERVWAAEQTWPTETSQTAWPEPAADEQAAPAEEPAWAEPVPEWQAPEAWPGQDEWSEPAAEEAPQWAEAQWPEAETWEPAGEAEAPVDAWVAEEDWKDAEPAWSEEPAWDEPAPELAEAEPAWSEVEPAWTEPTADESEAYAITSPPANAWAPTDEPFTYDGYTLYTRMVELSTGREQRIFFFARNEPKSGSPCPLPPGYLVETNERTGLPFLRRDATVEAVDLGGWGETETVEEELACLALTKAGTRCRNNPRDGSKYCTTHKGWRGPRAE